MTIADNTPRKAYVATAGQTDFPYTFEILAQTDLKVLKNGTTLALSTHYTVSGVGNENGGTVTLVTEAAVDDEIVIYRDMPLNRTTDYQNGARLNTDTLDLDLDRVLLGVQQVERDVGRAMRLSPADLYSPLEDLVLPDTQSRASKFLAFDTNGKPVASAGSATAVAGSMIPIDDTAGYYAGANVEQALSEIGTASRTFQSIALLKAGTARFDGEVVNVASYYASATPDGGGGLFRWDAASASADNGGTIIAPDAGGTGRWKRIYSGALNVKWFGARDSNNTSHATSNVTAIRAAIAAIANGGSIRFPYIDTGIYYVDDDIGTPQGSNQVFYVGDGITLRRTATTASYSMLYYRANMHLTGINLKGHIVSGSGWANVVPAGSFGFRSDSTSSPGTATFIDCHVDGLPFDGFYHNVGSLVLILRGSDGRNSYRNDLAIVAGTLDIQGGDWGNDNDPNLLPGSKVSTIDVEPNSIPVKSAIIQDIRASHRVSFDGANAPIEYVKINNVTIIGNSLFWYRVNNFELGRYALESGATISQANARFGSKGIGMFSRLPNVKASARNLLKGPSNDLSQWTVYSNGPGTSATVNTEIGEQYGIRVTSPAGSVLNYRQTVQVTAGKFYSFGGFIQKFVDDGTQMGIFVDVPGQGLAYLITPSALPELVAAAINIPEGVSAVTFYFGSNTTGLAHDATYTGMYFCEGIVGPDSVIVPSNFLANVAAYDPPSLADGDGTTTTVTVTGAALGDFAEASFSIDLQGITLTAWVSAANTVSVRFQNETGGALDLASGTLRARVRKA